MKFQQQQQAVQQQQQQLLASGPVSPSQDQLKQLKIQQLQMQQEVLKKRQDEIARQVDVLTNIFICIYFIKKSFY